MDASPATGVAVSLRQTALEHAGEAADYTELGLGFRRFTTGRWAFGLDWPLAMLRLPGETRVGMGNPMLFSEYRLALGAPLRFGLGAQASLPLGSLGEGLADDRFMGAIYAAVTGSFGYLDWNAAAGISMMLPPMEKGHGTHLAASPLPAPGRSYGNPHENRELLYRFAARKPLGVKHALTAALDGRHVIGKPVMDPRAGTDFLMLEAGAAFAAGTAAISPVLMAPVSASRRIGWGLGLTGSMAFR